MFRLCMLLVLFYAGSVQAEKLIVPPEYVVKIAKSLSYSDFPKTIDIIAIIRVESAFRPMVINPEVGSSVGPSRGLMQVQNGSLEVHRNMHEGVGLLREYYQRLGSSEAAIKSYNIGIGAYKQGRARVSAEIYWQKFSKRRKEYLKYYAFKGRLAKLQK